jgi:hypothetical protein
MNIGNALAGTVPTVFPNRTRPNPRLAPSDTLYVGIIRSPTLCTAPINPIVPTGCCPQAFGQPFIRISSERRVSALNPASTIASEQARAAPCDRQNPNLHVAAPVQAEIGKAAAF